MEDTKEIFYKIWCKQGGMLIRTDCLEYEHPESVWQQLIAQGVDPADHGFPHPHKARFREFSRDQLIAKIVELEQEILGREMYGDWK